MKFFHKYNMKSFNKNKNKKQKTNGMEMSMKLKKFLKTTSLIAVCATLVVGCAGKKQDEGATSSNGDVSVYLVLDRGGVQDQSFNQSAWAGAERAAEELGVEVKVATADGRPRCVRFGREDHFRCAIRKTFPEHSPSQHPRPRLCRRRILPRQAPFSWMKA